MPQRHLRSRRAARLRKRWIQPRSCPSPRGLLMLSQGGWISRSHTLGIFRVHQFEKVEQFVAVARAE